MIKLLGEQTSEKEIGEVVKEVDDNGDGKVDFEGKKEEEEDIITVKYQHYVTICTQM